MTELETLQLDLKNQITELKTGFGKFQEEKQLQGTVNAETKNALDKMQNQMDAIDLKISTAKLTGNAHEDEQIESGGSKVVADTDFKSEVEGKWPSLRSKGARFTIAIKGPLFGLNRKSLITTTAGSTVATTGVQNLTRLPGYSPLARIGLRIRDLCTRRTIDTGGFDYLKQLTRTNAASPQTEGSAKAESTYAWVSAAGSVQEIAHFVNITKQALADIPGIRGIIDDELLYGLKVQEEYQFLKGDGVGNHINGVQTQATAYVATYFQANDTKLDQLRHAKLQSRLIGLATYQMDGWVLSPKDLHDIELIKEEPGGVANKGLYLIGNPRGGDPIPMIWGLPVVESDSQNSGTFLGANFAGCEVIDREDATIEISYEHANNFTENKATIRAEERTGLAVRVPGPNITGQFS